jgi:sensor histidine kinase YesM
VSRLFQILTVIVTFSHSIYLFWSGGDQSFIYNHFLKFYIVLGIVSTYMTIYIIFKVKDIYKWFLLLGASVLGWAVAYEVVQIFVKEIPKPRDFFYTIPGGFLHFSYVEMSYVLESLIFLIGISFKNLKKEKERNAQKEGMIKQLLEREKEVNELLQDKLKSSLKELEMEQISSENQRNKAKLMQSQLSSLKLQMNPHYLFNSLNSINDFIISKRPEEASEYLALYARMMRSILKNSENDFNTIEQELQFSENYLTLESMRFEGKFSFKIMTPKSAAFIKREIPSMMLQPILENAVWHGMLPLLKDGEIAVDFTQITAKETLIIIRNNGPKLNYDSKTKSYGIKNVKEKIELLNKMYDIDIQFYMKDSEDGVGVLVKLFMPVFDKTQITNGE